MSSLENEAAQNTESADIGVIPQNQIKPLSVTQAIQIKDRSEVTGSHCSRAAVQQSESLLSDVQREQIEQRRQKYVVARVGSLTQVFRSTFWSMLSKMRLTTYSCSLGKMNCEQPNQKLFVLHLHITLLRDVLFSCHVGTTRAISLRATRANVADQRTTQAATTCVSSSNTLQDTNTGKDGAKENKRRRVNKQGSYTSSWRKDTNAGFFVEDEEEFKESSSSSSIPQRLEDLKPESHPQYPQHPSCVDCKQDFFNSQLQRQFGVNACDECQQSFRDGKYSLVTKTAAKNDYLLRDHDLSGRPDSLRFIEKTNQRNRHWSKMKLYLLSQVEERSFALYGDEDGLDAEFERREDAKRGAQVARQKKKMQQLRKDTLTARWMSASGKHTHQFGAETYDADNDEYSSVGQSRCRFCRKITLTLTFMECS
eukprot:m.297622 g.297622  ORF g.297622 m.297622 type:complete len:425 (-) comp20084_c0_seq2:571-1845(-)